MDKCCDFRDFELWINDRNVCLENRTREHNIFFRNRKFKLQNGDTKRRNMADLTGRAPCRSGKGMNSSLQTNSFILSWQWSIILLITRRTLL